MKTNIYKLASISLHIPRSLIERRHFLPSPKNPLSNSVRLRPFLSTITAIFAVITMTQSLAFGQTDSLKDSLSNVVSWENNMKWNSYINKNKLPQNDTLIFYQVIELTGNPLEYYMEPEENPQVANLDLISSSSSNKTVVENGANKYSRIYEYKYLPKTTGMAYINPSRLKIRHIPSNTDRYLINQRLSAEVTDPIVKRNYGKIALIVLSILVLGGIGFGIYYIIRKKKSKVVVEEVVEIPLETQYLDKIKLLKELTVKGDFESFFDKFPGLISEYITIKFGIPAKGMATSELISQLESSGLGGRDLAELNESLLICDRIRFAREKYDDFMAQKVILGFERLLKSFEPKPEIKENPISNKK